MGETGRKELVGLQWLRAFAAFSVLAHHAGSEIGKALGFENPLPVGVFGVDLFFVLSGTVLWISTRSIAPGRAAAWRFLVRRFLRITPLYWAVTLGLALLLWMAPSLAHGDPLANGRLWKSLLYVPQAGWPLLAVGWTLSHEMLFYAIFSLKVGVRRGVLLVVLVLLLCGAVGVRAGHGDASNWFQLVFSPFQLEFLLGLGCGWLHERGKLPHPGVPLVAMLCVGLAASLFEPGRWFLWGGLGAGICLIALRLEARLPGAGMGRLFGEASYASYLVHLPLVIVLARLAKATLGDDPPAGMRWIVLAGTVALCQTMALAVWRFVDAPVQSRLRAIWKSGAWG